MKKLVSLILLTLTLSSFAQKNNEPKLVVGIVVDQMRVDYIYRYWNRYSDGGFKRLVNNGFFFKNAQYDYVPTYTGPGHASIFTGTTPAVHGIIGNNWFVKEKNAKIYCTEDPSVKSVGSDSKAGIMSPRNMLTTTIGDELRLATTNKSKVFAISLKDRSSILPGGHNANAAFWYDAKTGNFISSTYYMNELPQWLSDFNNQKLSEKYLNLGWNTLYPIETYTQSTADDKDYEEIPNGFNEKHFPYSFDYKNSQNLYGLIRYTPHGCTITKEAALACIKAENLGKNESTDFISISFSSTDYIGHCYGPRSIETEDVYLRLDLELQDLFSQLDKQIGKNKYVVFLTADHGACDVPHYLAENRIPSGYIDEDKLEQAVKDFCTEEFGNPIVLHFINNQLYLDEAYLLKNKISIAAVEERIIQFLLSYPGVAEAYPSSALRYGNSAPELFRYRAQKGYNYVRSGNVTLAYLPGWLDYVTLGTTHGTSFNYDTHVPVLFYGAGIPKGQSFRRISITDIAPTISTILNIPYPNGNIGNPLHELFQNK